MTDRIGQVYDRIAPVYDFVFGLSLEGARKRALRHANVQPGEKVLEVGVGTGLTFRHLPKEVDFTGVDLSEKMLEKARKHADDLDVRHFKLINMNASKLEFPDESFDLIISAHFLSATSAPVPALLEMARVLKKNGRILLVNNFQRSESMSFFEPLVKKIGFSLALNLNELCLKTGLQVHKRQRVSLFMPIDAVTLIR